MVKWILRRMKKKKKKRENYEKNSLESDWLGKGEGKKIVRFRCFFLRFTGKFSSQIGEKSEQKTSGFCSGPKYP